MSDGASSWRRRWSLIAIVLFAVMVFTAARWASSAWEVKRAGLAQEWSESGDEAMRDSTPRVAVVAYRNALAYDANDDQLRYRLALALQAGGELDEAVAYLVAMREREPGNGRYNLALARMESARHDTSRAAEYYKAALLSQWSKEEIGERTTAWKEFVQLLLASGNTQQAVAQALALSADVPKDDPRQVFSAQVLFAQHHPAEANDVLGAYLRGRPADVGARDLQIRILLSQKRYNAALEESNSARERGALSQDAQQDAQTAQAALEFDPTLPHLSAAEQARRLNRILQRVETRMLACAPNGLLFQQADALMKRTSEHAAEQTSIVDDAISFAAARETEMQACAGDGAEDRAIRLLGRTW